MRCSSAIRVSTRCGSGVSARACGRPVRTGAAGLAWLVSEGSVCLSANESQTGQRYDPAGSSSDPLPSNASTPESCEIQKLPLPFGKATCSCRRRGLRIPSFTVYLTSARPP
ncbi:hypothetical protein N431DRAFT_438744 [Stipitochalara longipes BDJ]|nr:hypothetical protein N431DRAFT_438744 [Stipitochalara longipes BDJ]